MKLLRNGRPGAERPAMLHRQGILRDLSAVIPAIDDTVFAPPTLARLQPGDILSTGTPPGVGLGQKPPVYLRAGNVIKLGVEGLGEQQQRVVPFQHTSAPWPRPL